MSGFGAMDLLADGAADVFQQSYGDPLIQDQWTLPRLLPAHTDDDDLIGGYVHGGANGSSSQAIEARRRIEYVANKLNISCGI